MSQVERDYYMNLLKKMIIAISILNLISLGSCNNLPEENQNWVIVTKKQSEETGMASWLVNRDGFWTPSAEDILKLEERLAAYLSQNSIYFFQQPPVWERLDEYYRQYIGLTRGGKKIIYGNFFCDPMGLDWQETFVAVEDGGDCYFQVEYDVEGRFFIKLMVNGVS
jgi:hypothetical protein